MRHKVRLRKGAYWTLQVTLNFIVCLLKTVASGVLYVEMMSFV